MAPQAVLSVLREDGVVQGQEPEIAPDTLLHAYRTMVLTRHLDERAMRLQRAGRIGFTVPNKGVEAVQIGAAAALRSSDWIFPSYRDFGMALHHGVPVEHMLHGMFCNGLDHSKGRQMPVHYTFADPIRFVSISSPIGTHIPQAVGAARAAQQRGEDTVFLTSFGDGGTSSLGFHSGLVFAGVWKSPVIFLCQNNGWAISCPADKQTGSDGFAVKGEGYGVPGVQVDGNDFLAVYTVVLEAVTRARRGEGPTLIEAITMRMGGHSSSDDPTKYVPAEVLEAWAKKDPIARFEKYLRHRGLLDDAQVQAAARSAEQQVAAAVEAAEKAPLPAIETIFTDVYAEVPPSLRQQGRDYFELMSRHGEAAAGDGAFPL
jgi:pyruvate dehydrogenase E1 component alpha subunit